MAGNLHVVDLFANLLPLLERGRRNFLQAADLIRESLFSRWRRRRWSDRCHLLMKRWRVARPRRRPSADRPELAGAVAARGRRPRWGGGSVPGGPRCSKLFRGGGRRRGERRFLRLVAWAPV